MERDSAKAESQQISKENFAVLGGRGREKKWGKDKGGKAKKHNKKRGGEGEGGVGNREMDGKKDQFFLFGQ